MADFDPSSAVLAPTPGQFDPSSATEAPPPVNRGLAGSALSGIKAGTAGLLQGAALVGSVPAIAFDAARGAVTGQDTTAAQDWYFKHAVDPLANYAERQQLRPEESSFGNQVAYGVGGMVPTAAAAVASGGALEAPAIAGFAGRALAGVGAMAAPSALQGVTQAGNLVRQGIDVGTAEGSGAVTALTGAAMGAVPMAAAGGLVKRAVTGAVSGLATGEAGRVAQNAVLGDHPELQTEMTPQNLAVNAAIGAMFGAVLGPSAQKAEIGTALESAKADVAAGEPISPEQQAQQKAFMDTAQAAPVDTLKPGEMTPVDQYLQAEQLGNQIKATTPAPEGAPDLPGGADLNAQFGVQRGMDQIAQEAQTQQAKVFQQGLDTAPIDSLKPGEQTPVDQFLAQSQAKAPLALENRPETMVAFPDGSVGTQAQADAYIAALPEDQRVAARAKLLGYGAQPNENSLAGTWRQQMEAADIDTTGMRGQYLAKLNQTINAADAMPTPEAKIAALEAARDKTSSSTISYAVLDKLAENMKTPEGAPATPETPVIEAAKTAAVTPEVPLAETAPGASVDIATAPAQTAPVEAAAEALKATTPPPTSENPTPAPAEAAVPATVKENAQVAADKIDATLADFNARVRNGEQLTPLEQERMQDAQDFRGVLANALRDDSPRSEDFVKDITDYANQTATPYTKSFRSDYQAPVNSEARSAGIVKQLLTPNADASTMLQHLADNGSEQWVRDLATKLQSYGLTTKMGMAQPGELNQGTLGFYDGVNNTARFAEGGESEHVVLHELTHAATTMRLVAASQIDKPRNQEEAQLKQSYKDLNKIRIAAIDRTFGEKPYGLTDPKEFLAELNTNPDFQKFLDTKSLWGRTVDAVRRMLGMEPNQKTALEKAMDLQGPFFSGDTYKDLIASQQNTINRNAEFNASMKGAGDITDDSLSGVAKAIDTVGNKVSIKGMDMAAFRFLSGAKTVQYMADRVRALPEMVAAGMDKGVDGILAAHDNMRQAAIRAGEAPGKFNDRLGKMLRSMKDDDARALNKNMAEIGTGSSIGGFDPTMNFSENLKERPDLSPTNKAYIDQINRQFKQLESANPDAAKAIVEGAKIHRQETILNNASILKNLIEQPSNQGADTVAMQRHAAGLDFMSKDLQTARNGDSKKFLDGMSSTLDQRIRDAFADAKNLPEGNALRDQLAALEPIYDNSTRNPYYSAGRDGNYFLNVGFKDMDDATWAKMQTALKGTNKVLGDYTNQDHAFMRFDTMDQAVGMRQRLVQAMGEKLADGTLASGALSDNGNLSSRSGVSEALRSVLSSLHDTVDNNPGLQGPQAQLMKEALTRKFLSMLPETSSKLATIKRMGIPGYDGDFQGNFARRAAGGVQDTANLYAMPQFSNAFKQIGSAVDNLSRTGTPEMQEKARIVSDELNLRHANSMQPVQNTAINLINTLGHSFYLAMSPAFYIRTMAQPWHRAMPILGSRYGFVNSAKEIANATPAALRIIAASIKQGWDQDGLSGLANAGMKFNDIPGLKPNEEAFIQALHDRGDLKLGQAQQLQTMKIGGNQKVQDLARAASMTAQYAEMTNRLVTGLAAFRLAEKGASNVSQKGSEANTEYARDVISRAMDNFDSYNTARAIGKHGVFGKVTPLATQFMNYQMQTMQQIARTVHDGMFNRDQSPEGIQRSAEAKKEFAGLFATTAMISGAMGLPFVNAFAGVYNTLTQDEDNPSDIRESARNGLADMFGQDVGNVLSHGIGAAVGLDTSTFGLQNLLPGSEFIASRRLLKDRFADQAEALMGPAINGIADVAKAGVQISDGYYVKGIEAALPTALKGYFKAWELADRGYTDSKGNPIGLKATPGDVAWQALGLRPETKAVQAEAQGYSLADQERRQDRSTVIRNHIMQAIGDPEATADAMQEMRDFNAKNMTQPITNDAIMQTIKQHAMMVATGEISGTGVGASNGKQLVNQNTRLRFAKGNNASMP